MLVALSGGADSMALLHMLVRLGYPCTALHCNFHLRGEESMRDESFVRATCAEWEVPLQVRDFDTKVYAAEHGVSIEMAARDLRYTWFEEVRQQMGVRRIAVAHHQNDQAETMLLHLDRGCGIRGLGGMKPMNGAIIRPLLCLTRAEIEAYCVEQKIDYVTDSTNADTTIQRNGLRAWLNQQSESTVRHYAQTAEWMQGYLALMEKALDGMIPMLTEMTDHGYIIYPERMDSTWRDVMIYEICRRWGIRVEDLIREHDALVFRQKEPMPVYALSMQNETVKAGSRPNFPAADAMLAMLDGDRINADLTVRFWQAGDAFYPLGMMGKRKLQDFFSDLHLTPYQKSRIPIVCCGNEIVWVAGYRIDDRYKWTPKTTNLLTLSLILCNNSES